MVWFGPMETRWQREGNGTRSIAGLSRDYTLPLIDGHRLLVVATGLDYRYREALFCAALWRYWFARFGDAGARGRMRAYVRGEEVA